MRVLIIDSYPLFREAIALQVVKVIERASIFEAATREEASALLKVAPAFDLVICCISDLERERQCVQAFHNNSPEMKILILLDANQQLSQHFELEKVSGFLPKSVDIHELKSALKLILMGEIYISPSLLVKHKPAALVSDYKPTKSITRSLLTPRQLEVLKLIAAGFSNKAIANELHCSDGTIKLHVSAILKEFKVNNRVGAIKYAAKLGLISNA